MSNSENIKSERKERKNEKKGNIESNVNEKCCVTTGKNLMEKNNVSMDTMKKFPLYLQYLYLIPNESQSYEVFRNVGFSLKSCGASQEDFRNWASLSNKYHSKTGGKLISRFNSFLLGKQCLKLPYLKRLALESHPEYFDESISRLNNYFDPCYDGMRIIKEDTQYVSSLNSSIKEKFILIKSQLGSGKTTCIKKFINDNNYTRILFLSPRITFSQFISKEFDTSFYLDENVNLNNDKLTISMESIHKLEGNQPYDVIIMDECEANLSVFSSSTIKQNQIKCFEILSKFIQNSKRTIFASAFITQKSIDYIKSFDFPVVCIYNTVLPNKKKVFRFHEDVLILKLIESIHRKEKNYCVFSSKKLLVLVCDIIRGLGVYEADDILVYSSDADDTQIDTLKNIHETWSRSKIVLTSPSITVGNSYKPDIIDFDNTFCFGRSTCIVADTFQGLKRVRETKSNTLYFSLPDKESLNTNKRFANHKFDIINNFDKLNDAKTYKMKSIIQELMLTYQANLLMYQSNYNKLSVLQNNFCDNRIKTPRALKKIIMFNYEEQTISDCYYEAVFYSFLKINNYQFDIEIDSYEINDENKTKMDQLMKQSISSKILYNDIPLVLNQTMEIELTRKQTYKKATHIEKLQLQKYHMIQKIDTKIINEDYQSKLFELFISQSHKHIFHNVYEEQLHDLDKSLLYGHHIDKSTKENMNNTPLKIYYIIKINQELGIQNTCIGTIIPRENIENLSSFFKKEIDNIIVSFGFAKNNVKCWNFAAILIILKKIYKSWSDCRFESNTDNNRRVTSVEFIPCLIFIENQISNPFIKNDIQKHTPVSCISDSLKEQINIDNEIQALENRRKKREEEREQERIEDEIQISILKQREIELDKQIEKHQLENTICKLCKNKNKTCICIKINTFFN